MTKRKKQKKRTFNSFGMVIVISPYTNAGELRTTTMITVKMNKIDLGSYGEAYTLTLGNIESPGKKDVTITISECEAEKLKPLFSNNTKRGKFKENEEWI